MQPHFIYELIVRWRKLVNDLWDRRKKLKYQDFKKGCCVGLHKNVLGMFLFHEEKMSKL